jgi:hypothetical protein
MRETMRQKFARVPLAGVAGAILCAALANHVCADASDKILAQITPTFVFRHPGTLNTIAELRKIQAKILAGEQPWKGAFEKMQASPYARRDYTPHPVAIVSGGRTEANAIRDAVAAYTQALLWVLTGDEWHAQKAGDLIDAWSSTLTSFDGLAWYLDPAWIAAPLVEAAEILRATYPKWGGAERLGRLFNDVFLPNLHGRLSFGNREFAVTNAMLAIGVFNEDRAAFYEGIHNWLRYIPSYFYIASDGPEPKPADYWLSSPSDEFLMQLDGGKPRAGWASWIELSKGRKGDDKTALTKDTVEELWHHPGAYLPGYTPETGGRDLGHTENAFLSAVNTAEIAWNQGIDIYSIAAPRLSVFMETMASIRLGEPISPAAYGGNLPLGNGLAPTYEIAYNHLHNKMSIALPKTRQLIETVIRQMGPEALEPPFPSQFPASLRANRIWEQAGWTANWETLTHGELDRR